MIHSQKNIFIYWDSGFDTAPELCKLCAESWVNHHEQSEWTVHLLAASNLNKYITGLDPEDVQALEHQLNRIEKKERCGDIVKLTDMLRLALLDAYGGVWADATVLCLAPLDTWPVSADESLIVPISPARNRRHEAWFIMNMNGSSLLRLWKETFRDRITGGVDFVDDWKFTRRTLFYWLKRIGSNNPTIASRIWSSRLTLKWMKVQPYFSINHCAEAALQQAKKSNSSKLRIDIRGDISALSKTQFESGLLDLEHGLAVKLNHKWDSKSILTTLKTGIRGKA